MTKRQLQQFFIRFTAGVAASLLAGLAAMYPMLWIGMGALALGLLIQLWGVIAKWQAYFYQKTSVNARYEAMTPNYQPIALDQLISSTTGFAVWFLAILIGVLLVLCPQLFTSISTLLNVALWKG
jgi:hypothetical protein